MNVFDTTILHFLNQFAAKSFLFDDLIAFVCNTPFRGVIFISALWWLWFRQSETQSRARTLIVSGLAVSLFSLFVTRGLAFSLPFRERPASAPALHFRLPYGVTTSGLIPWSSFPSDHAALYFCIATSIFLISRKIGFFAYLYAFFVISLPRVYTGTHYPTDILVGAILGIGIGSILAIAPLSEWIARRPLRWVEQSPGIFYAVFFVITFLFSTQFDAIRDALGDVHEAVVEVKQAHHHMQEVSPRNSDGQATKRSTVN